MSGSNKIAHWLGTSLCSYVLNKNCHDNKVCLFHLWIKLIVLYGFSLLFQVSQVNYCYCVIDINKIIHPYQFPIKHVTFAFCKYNSKGISECGFHNLNHNSSFGNILFCGPPLVEHDRFKTPTLVKATSIACAYWHSTCLKPNETATMTLQLHPHPPREFSFSSHWCHIHHAWNKCGIW